MGRGRRQIVLSLTFPTPPPPPPQLPSSRLNFPHATAASASASACSPHSPRRRCDGDESSGRRWGYRPAGPALSDRGRRLQKRRAWLQAQIAMPPPETIANVKIRCNGEGMPDGYDLFTMDMSSRDFDDETEPDDLSWEEGRFYFYMRVVLSADPSSGNCTVMILHLLNNFLSFARVGATHWTWINVNELCWNYHDVLYNDDDRLFYAIRGNGDVHAINTNGPSPILRVVLDAKNSLVDCAKYIVLSESGDLLQVWRYYHVVNNNKERRTRELVFYKVDLVEHKLVELKDFEGHALFIGFNSSFFLRVEDFPMLTPNSVYCTDDTVPSIYCSRFGFREVSAFHLEDSSFTDLLPIIGSRLNWPPPVWFRPSYSKGPLCCNSAD